MATPETTMPPQPEEPPRSTRTAVYEKDRVGDILRRVREHRGEDIESISDYLRIRPSFLIALENSHYDELPADAYVIGFLRTYALYLGLDGRGAIDQYRREMAGRRRKPQLSMPQPMSEGRTPTAAVLIGAAVLCLLIYGLWYGLATPDREIIEKPLELPQPTAEETSTPASEALAATPAGDLLLETTTGASETVSSLAAQQEVKQEEKAPEKNASKEEPKKDAPKEEVKKPEPQPAAAPEKPAEKPDGASQPIAEKQQEPPKPQSYGEAGKTRMVVRAEEESWVLITDSKGVTVFERVLKPGETYNVPAAKGLNLTAGNASGIVLSLDGKPLPRLSNQGRVVRGIPLDPDKAKNKESRKESKEDEKKPSSSETSPDKPTTSETPSD